MKFRPCTVAPCLLLLAACGKRAASSVTKTVVGGVEKTAVRVEDPSHAGKNLVEVDWLRFTGTTPVDLAANKWLEQTSQGQCPVVPATEEAALEYANPKAGPVEMGGIFDPHYNNCRAPVAVEIVRKDDAVLALLMLDKTEHFGGESFSGPIAAANFDARTGARLPVEALLDESKVFQDAVHKAILAGNPNTVEEVMEPDFFNEGAKIPRLKVGAEVFEVKYFIPVLSLDGVRLLQPLEVKGGGRKILDFTIPYSSLKGILPEAWMPPEKK